MKIKHLVALVWIMKTFITYNGVLEFLNTLSDHQQKAAKIVCDNYHCAVFYPKEDHR